MKTAISSRSVRQVETDFLLVETDLDVISDSAAMRALQDVVKEKRGEVPVVFRATKRENSSEVYVWSGLGEPAKTIAQLLAFEPHADGFAWEESE